MTSYATELDHNLQLLYHQLQADTPARWGLMGAQHMLEHLALSFKLSTGKMTLDEPAPPDRIAHRQKRFFEADVDFAHNIKMPFLPAEAPAPLFYPDFDTAREALRAEVQAFFDYFAANPQATCVHLYFGGMGGEQWTQFHARHTRHHLAQFGLR